MSLQESHGGQQASSEQHLSIHISWVSPQEKNWAKENSDFLDKASESPASTETKIYYSTKKGERRWNFLEIAILQLLRRHNLEAIYKSATVPVQALYSTAFKFTISFFA